jgi:hypothetical protein
MATLTITDLPIKRSLLDDHFHNTNAFSAARAIIPLGSFNPSDVINLPYVQLSTVSPGITTMSVSFVNKPTDADTVTVDSVSNVGYVRAVVTAAATGTTRTNDVLLKFN